MALESFCIEDEETPFEIPNLPEYSSRDRNELSIVGRLLNPAGHKIANVIFDMPRKWQKKDKVRGIALTKEKFQFVFNNEQDLLEVVERGVHTHNEWSLAIERWKEAPSEDYLKFIPLWVQIRNIPINYYTAKTITALGELIGKVDEEVILDTTKHQLRDFVRVKVRFDVSKPLKKSKLVILPSGEQVTVLFSYERVQKRCLSCQRLTHEQSACPYNML